jgi:deoxyribonuclease V
MLPATCSADGALAAAVDVHYPASGGARAAAVLSAGPSFSLVVDERVVTVSEVLPYQPGAFYLRELPALLAVLAGQDALGLVVVDGYADLDSRGRPGLGARLHAELGVPVIGVAKSAYRTATHAIPVLRGTSSRPVFVTATGLPRAEAADLVRQMSGRFRVPDALRRADALARTPV